MNALEVHGAQVELQGLSKRYPRVTAPAVDAVDLVIGSGEFMTLLGPSGSGKTTTLNMIAGFIPPTSGRILLDGVDVASTPTHTRNIGVVFQNYSLFPHMTVAKNIAYPLRRRRVPRPEADRLVAEALDMVHLSAMADRSPKALSGGQQQRVALARALVFRPPLLLLDEPLGALDKNLREAMQQEISTLHRELGTTFVFVTHDQEEALAMSDRIAIFDGGRIRQVGTGDELYDSPASLFVARFLGDSNALHGTVVAGGERPVVEVAGARLAGRSREALRVGDRAVVVVRPERVILSAGETASFRGRVTAFSSLGPHRKLRVVLADGAEILVREPSAAPVGAVVGAEVGVGWRAEDAVVLRDDAAIEAGAVA